MSGEPRAGAVSARSEVAAGSERARLLSVESLSAGYGKRAVIGEVSITVGAGEIVALLGHNGAGKTTTLKAIAGLVRPREGRVQLDGAGLTGRPPAAAAAAGVAFVPQGHGVFPSLSVEENLALGASIRQRRARWDNDASALVDELFPMLNARPKLRAGSLSGGQRQMLAISMALMAEPRLLLLDEPSMGLAPVLVDEVLEAVRRVNQETRVSVLLVEQNIKRVLAISERAYVLKLGSVVFGGTPDGLRERDWSELF
ncbi:MAG: ATP-binding cassette domain-containing protein [Pseudonocardiaceae bacterium]|nr:ATP-binding cassette domain-containing protein [Pseudonocardiaceae bacterium]